jgi:hypothetical protein
MGETRRKGPFAGPPSQRWVRPLTVIGGAPPIDLIENNMMALVIHGMIPLEGWSEGSASEPDA